MNVIAIKTYKIALTGGGNYNNLIITPTVTPPFLGLSILAVVLKCAAFWWHILSTCVTLLTWCKPAICAKLWRTHLYFILPQSERFDPACLPHSYGVPPNAIGRSIPARPELYRAACVPHQDSIYCVTALIRACDQICHNRERIVLTHGYPCACCGACNVGCGTYAAHAVLILSSLCSLS